MANALEMEEIARLDSLATMPVDSLAAEAMLVEHQEVEAEDAGGVMEVEEEAIEEAPVEGEAGNDEEPEKEVIELDVKSLKDLEREAKRLEQEQHKAERDAAREARWAELDARDAAKAAKKEARALKKERARKLKMVRAQEKRAAKEQKILDRYIKRYEKQKARRQQRKEK
jgi:hypothetical protein